jgi:hypothetical protein
MKIVTYSFKKPAMDAARVALINTTIERLGGTVEGEPPERIWSARFVVDGPGGLVGHRRLVVEAIKATVGVTPVIVRTRVERASSRSARHN